MVSSLGLHIKIYKLITGPHLLENLASRPRTKTKMQMCILLAVSCSNLISSQKRYLDSKKKEGIRSKLELHILPLNLKASKYIHCLKKKCWKCLWLVIRIWRHLKNGPVLAQVASVPCDSNVLPNAAPEIVASAEEPLTTRKISERRVQEMQLSTWPSAATIAVEKKQKAFGKKKNSRDLIDPKIAWKTGKHHGFPPFLRFTGRFTFSFHRFTPFRPFFESLVLSGWVSLTARSAASRSAELSGLACEEVPSFLDMKLHEIQKEIIKTTLGQWVPHLLDPSTRAYALNTGDVTIGFLRILLTLAKWRRTKVGDKIIPGLTDPLESKPLKKLQIGSFLFIAKYFLHLFHGQNPMSWIIQKVCLNEWDMTSTLSRNYRCAQHVFLKTSRDPCNSCTGVSGPMQRCTCNFQLPWSIPKFSAKSRGING